MLTTTLPHYAHESCQQVLDKFTEATKKMKYQQVLKNSPHFIPWRHLLQHYKNDGYVITKEVLYGQNGWHIHTHGLFIFKKKIKNQLKARERFYEAWLKACDLTFQIADYPDYVVKAFAKRSIRFDHLSGDSKKIISEYMTKSGIVRKEKELGEWRMEHEMTKSHLKKSESGSLTPFGMLERIRQLAPDSKEAKILKQKYFEYTQALKGTSFVRWSPGLRAQFGIDIKTDEEIVQDNVTGKESVYGSFPRSDWYRIIIPNGLRGFIQEHSNLDWDDLMIKITGEIKYRISQKELARSD